MENDKPLRMRWMMISFALVATILNYVHRLSFVYLSANGFLRDLIPDDSFGYIATSFFIAYLLSNAVSGFIIDKLGTRLGYSLCMAFWTTAGILHAVARSPFQFGVFRFMLGIGEAGNWPAAIKLTSEWFPPEERSTASGIFNSGAAAGAGNLPFAYSMAWNHIRMADLLSCYRRTGLSLAGSFWFTYYTPEKLVKEAKARTLPPMKLLKNRFVLYLTLSKVFIDPVWYFITFWIGRYLADTYGWNLAKIGWFAIFPFVVADFGNILGGLFTQMIIKRGIPVPRARKTGAAIFGSIMALSLLFGPLLISGPVSALTVLALAGFGYASLSANLLAFPADVVPLSATASVWGIASVGSGLGGAVFQSLSGIAVKNLSAKFNYAIAYNFVFIGYGVIALIGVLIVLFMTGPLVRNMEFQEYADSKLSS